MGEERISLWVIGILSKLLWPHIQILVYSWQAFCKAPVLYCLFYFTYFNKVHFNIWIWTFQFTNLNLYLFQAFNSISLLIIIMKHSYWWCCQCPGFSKQNINNKICCLLILGDALCLCYLFFSDFVLPASENATNRSQWPVGCLLQSIFLCISQ